MGADGRGAKGCAPSPEIKWIFTWNRWVWVHSRITFLRSKRHKKRHTRPILVRSMGGGRPPWICHCLLSDHCHLLYRIAVKCRWIGCEDMNLQFMSLESLRDSFVCFTCTLTITHCDIMSAVSSVAVRVTVQLVSLFRWCKYHLPVNTVNPWE